MVVQGQSRGLCMSRGLDCFMDCLFRFSVDLPGKQLFVVAMCGRSPTQHQRNVQICYTDFRFGPGFASLALNIPALPAFTMEQQLVLSKRPGVAPE